MKKIIVAALVFTTSALVFANAEKDENAVENYIQMGGKGMNADNGSRSGAANETEQVLEMVRIYTRSVNEGDVHPELIDKLWEHSPQVSNINIRGHQKGFDDIKTNFYAPIYAVLKDRNLRMVTDERKPAVYIFDNTAVVEFYWKLNATVIEDNKAVSMAGRETHVYRKTSDGWKLVHLHYSGMPVTGF
ncbi:YybH family protein [Pseudomonas turukhanskensis]|nr:nuclear transport factor 2 family protein [Pseudomonas turukhanskensis]